MPFDGVFKLNLNLMERKHLFFTTEAYWEHRKILLQTCDAVGVCLCLRELQIICMVTLVWMCQ